MNSKRDVLMNTERSDKLAAEWTRKKNPLARASFACERRFNTTPAKLFPLLCPTTEYDWLPGWECELLHSASGYTEYNAVFRTKLFGPEEIWVCTRFEPGKAIEYSRTSAHTCAKMEISLLDHYDGTVTGRWVILTSALDEAGNQMVSAAADDEWLLTRALDYLAHYIDTGEMAVVQSERA